MAKEYEWGIMFPLADTKQLHRGPWTEAEAREWLRGAKADGFRPGMFVLVRREVGPWETAEP